MQRTGCKVGADKQHTFCGCAGEYGELLLGKADAPLQSGEEALSVSSQELVQVLQTVLSRPTIKPVGREYALTALMKLSTRLPDHSQYIQVTARVSSARGPVLPYVASNTACTHGTAVHCMIILLR